MSSVEHAFLDLTAGVIGGCSGIVVGQPFDTVKVRLQTHSTYYKGPIDCARITLRNEGVRGFFKGMTSPLVGNAWTNAIVFSTYASAIRYAEGNTMEPKISSVYFAGAFAGFFQSLAVCPTELIKCRLQVQDGHADTKYTGPLDCIKDLYKRHGFRGYFIGWWSTMYREVPSFGVYFSVYEYVKRLFNEDPGNPSMMAMFTAGGVSGVLSWTISYPADVIKSSIQTLSDNAPLHERKISFQAKRLYRMGGLKIFTKGLGTTIVRAFPVNAVTLSFYEMTTQSLKEYFID